MAQLDGAARTLGARFGVLYQLSHESSKAQNLAASKFSL